MGGRLVDGDEAVGRQGVGYGGVEVGEDIVGGGECEGEAIAVLQVRCVGVGGIGEGSQVGGEAGKHFCCDVLFGIL